MVQRLTFEELHDSVVGDVVDFKEFRLAGFDVPSVSFYNSGKLEILHIYSNIIGIVIHINKELRFYITIFKNEKCYIELTY